MDLVYLIGGSVFFIACYALLLFAERLRRV